MRDAVGSFDLLDSLVNNARHGGQRDVVMTADFDSWYEPFGTNVVGT